ncbi:hypothetical protein MTBUT4_400010 [Magnetospirillum sp. UT-4]|nr:hypothetical protein MTBUT4_400010 [Magnetospirillum sp. UT-4]
MPRFDRQWQYGRAIAMAFSQLPGFNRRVFLAPNASHHHRIKRMGWPAGNRHPGTGGRGVLHPSAGRHRGGVIGGSGRLAPD